MTFAPEVYLFLVIVVLVAAFLNGAAGYGFAFVAVVCFAFVLDPKVGIIVISVITPVLTTLQLHRHWAFRGVTRRIAALLAGSVVGTVVGTQLLIILPGYVLSLLLAGFAVWFAVSSMRRGPMKLSAARERYAAPPVGLIAGIANGTVGASGPVLGSYLLAIGLKGRDWVFAISVVFWAMSLIRAVTLGVTGQYHLEIVLLGLALSVPAYVAQAGGFAMQARLSAEAFQRIILVILLVSGANLLVRGLSQAIASF
jgi:uncharacterized membrane protein YfcA